MPREISAEEARNRLPELLDQVASGNGAVVIEKKGKPCAVLIAPEQWEHYQRLSKERFFEVVDAIQERNAEKDPDEVYRDVTAVVDEVRQGLYDQQHRQPPRSSGYQPDR